MKAILFVLALISLVSLWGCATRIENGVRKFTVMPQVGVIVTVQNNCAPTMTVESLYGVEVKALAFGDSATIPISSRFMVGGRNRQIWVMAKAYDQNLRYIGSKEMRESVSISRGTRDRLWMVDDLDSPSGARCKVGP